MAARIWETWDSAPTRIANDQSSNQSLHYIVDGTTNEVDVAAALLAKSPPILNGLERDSFDFEPMGYGIWRGVVGYIDPDLKRLQDEDRRDPPAPGEIETSFDTSGGSLHITHSIKTRLKKPAPGKTAPDFKGAINVERDGDRLTIQGVDVTIPALALSLRTRFLAGVVDQQKVKAYADLTGKINVAPYKGFAAGELLFVGAQGTINPIGETDVTFSWLASANVTTDVGPITNVAKGGWDYLWVYTDWEDDAAAKTTVLTPRAVYVEQVYLEGDFTMLGLGP